jgi:hypothetical protein
MKHGPILIIGNTFQTLFLALLLLVLIKSENTKNIFTFLQSYQKPKNSFTLLHYSHISLVYIVALLFNLLHLLFIFTYIQHLVLENHSVELGTQDKEIVLQVA